MPPSTPCDNLLFGIRRSVRYHNRRLAFFEGVHQCVLLSALLLSSAAAVSFAAEFATAWPTWLKLLPPLLVALLTGLDLVSGISRKARLHDDLKRRFINLEQTLVSAGDEDEQALTACRTARLTIEQDEPPVLRVLDTLCHNELLRAMGYPRADQIPVTPLQRLLAPMLDWREHAIIWR